MDIALTAKPNCYAFRKVIVHACHHPLETQLVRA
jgi:hypothetical protein